MKTRLFTLSLLLGLLAILVFSLTGSVTAQKNLQLEKPEVEVSAALTLVSISPASFANGVNMPVTIVGSNLDAVISATLGTVALRNLQVVSSTQVMALVPWSIVTGTYTLTVQSQGAPDAILPGAVTVTAGSTDWTSNGPYGGDLWDVVIDPVHSARLFVSANRSGLWRTENGGDSWLYANTLPFFGRTEMIYSATDQPPAIYGACCLRSLDYGQTWERKAPAALEILMGGADGYYFVRPDQPTWVYSGLDPYNVVEPLGGVYTSTDRGDTWSLMTSTSGLHITALAFDPDNYDHLILGTHSGQVYTSTNGGTTWSDPITITNHIQRLMFAPTLYNGKRSLWGVAGYSWQYQNDNVYRSTNGGQTWTSIRVVTGASNYDITFHDSIPGLMWAAVGNGYYSEDGGTTWHPVGAGLDGAHGFAVMPGAISRQTTTLFAATRVGLYKSTNGGDTWEESDNGLGANLARAIAISPFNADEAYAATQAKGLLHTFDGGRSWQGLPIPIGGYDPAIAPDPFTNGKVYFGNVDSGRPPAVQISNNHGLTFTEHTLTLPPPYSGWNADVAAIAPDPTIKDRILAGVCMGNDQPGFIYASTNGGLTWITQTTPINVTCISRLTFDPNNPNVVYAGASGSGLLRSTDRGATWALMANQPTKAGFMSVEIDPSDSNSIYLCTFDQNGIYSGIYATHDGGVTWVKMTGAGGPIWALKFVKVGANYWLYAATMNNLRYLRTIPDDPTIEWERASGIAGVAAADGFNAATEEGRVVYYVGNSGGTVPTSSSATRDLAATAGSQNIAGGIYRSMLTNSQYESLYGTPGWQLKNRSGFGNQNNMISTLEVFNSELYAATINFSGGARVWRLPADNIWTPASEVGMSSSYSQTNDAIYDLVTFNGSLYASLSGATEGQLWRTANGADWTKVISSEFASNRTATVLVVFSNTLYAATSAAAVEIWRSSTGNSGSWERIVQDSFGNPNNSYVAGAAVLSGTLYVSVVNSVDGITIWRTTNGTTWTQANPNGFGDAANVGAGGMATLGGYLYAGTRNDVTGGQIWRYDGNNWSLVIADGFGNANNFRIDSLYTVQNQLFAVARNSITGLQVWRTTNGTDWTAVNLNGLGNSKNVGTLWSNASAAFANSFYVGTANGVSGGEVWQYVVDFPVYLPLVMR